MKERIGSYLVALGAVLPPAGGGRDVGFLGRGVDALVAETDHAVACLVEGQQCAPVCVTAGLSVTSSTTAGSVEDLNWEVLVRCGCRELFGSGHWAFHTSNKTTCMIAMGDGYGFFEWLAGTGVGFFHLRKEGEEAVRLLWKGNC